MLSISGVGLLQQSYVCFTNFTNFTNTNYSIVIYQWLLGHNMYMKSTTSNKLIMCFLKLVASKKTCLFSQRLTCRSPSDQLQFFFAPGKTSSNILGIYRMFYFSVQAQVWWLFFVSFLGCLIYLMLYGDQACIQYSSQTLTYVLQRRTKFFYQDVET